MLIEGVLLIALGVAGFVSATAHPDAGVFGPPVLVVLTLTPWHSVLLTGTGVFLAASTARRRAAIVATAATATGYLILVFVGAVAAVHHAPGPLGLQTQSVILHGVISAVNLGMLYWLLPDELTGPAWVRRRRTNSSHRDGANR